MVLQSPNFWEIVFDVTQISLCGFIILFLILNRIKFKRLIMRPSSREKPTNRDTEFVIEAVRQQTELAFNHIAETIAKERETLDAVYHQDSNRIASGLLVPVAAASENQNSKTATLQPDPVVTAYNEIEILADQGLNPTEIAERVNVAQGEIDLVLKLKHMRDGSVKKISQSTA